MKEIIYEEEELSKPTSGENGKIGSLGTSYMHFKIRE